MIPRLAVLLCRPPRRHVIALLVLLGVVVLTPYVHKALRGSDFGAYHAAGRAVLEGSDIYDARSERGRDYIYPPLLAVLVTPLALLPEGAAGCIWVVLNLLALFVALRLLRTMLRREAPSFPPWVLVAGTLAIAEPINNDLGNGQVNLVVLLLIVGIAWAWDSKREGWAGVFAAAGAALKATPVFFLLYFVVRRSPRALVGFALGAVLTFVLIPSLGLGFEGAIAANQRWYGMMAQPYAEGRDYLETGRAKIPPYHAGSTLRPTLYNTLRPARVQLKESSARIELANVPEPVVEWLWRGLASLLVLAALVRLDRSGGSPSALRDIAMLAVVMVIIAPVSRKAHLVSLLPATTWLALQWERHRDRIAARALVICFLATSLVLWTVPRTWKQIWIAAGGYLIGTLVVFIAISLRGRRSNATPTIPAAAPSE